MAIPSQTISQMTTLVGSNSNDNCFFTLYNDLISGSANQNLKARISTHEQFYSNNNTIVNQGNYNNYFGTGKNGSVTISSSAQISSSTSPGGLNNISREHGDIIVKNFQNLTINSGVLFSPLRPCRGMLIYCTGNLTVNGTISMTGKGGGVANKIAAPIGNASSTDSRYDLVDATLYFNNCSSSVVGGRGIPTHWNWAPSGSAWFSNYKMRIPLSGSVAGGTGAGPGANSAGGTGTAGIFCCGGGGGGASGAPNANLAGSGGRGTIFAGGAGGQGGYNNTPSLTPAAFEASIGTATSFAGGGGAGNPSSPAGTAGPTPSLSATPGVGGLLILIVRGNVTINGTLSSNGSSGGNGNGFAAGGAGGGGSGGGRIIIIYGGTYSNAGSIVTSGGNAGTTPGGSSGGAGGAGSTTIRRVNI